MRLLITGASGFVGTWLCEAAVAAGHSVFALVRSPWPGPAAVTAIQGELGDQASLARAIDTVRPEGILHLAAFSAPSESWKDPLRVFDVNLNGLIRLLEAVAASPCRPRIVVASSGHAYGLSGELHHQLTEDAPFRPISPYGSSKAAADLVAGQYAVDHDLDIVRLRLFNHTGPGRPGHYVLSSFARQLVGIASGREPAVLEVGCLEVWRDFSDVRDIVAAWLASLEGTVSGEAYNVCSGNPVLLRDVLEQMCRLAGVEPEIRRLPNLDRRTEIERLCGDPSRFQAVTGWRPVRPLESTLSDLLEWWHARLE